MMLAELLEGDGFATRLTGRYGRIVSHEERGVKVWWLDRRSEQYLHPEVQVDEADLLGVPRVLCNAKEPLE